MAQIGEEKVVGFLLESAQGKRGRPEEALKRRPRKKWRRSTVKKTEKEDA